jgi:LacI family transcriptional regulator
VSTIHEVAKRARVSLGTVSNVLNHPELVAEATRERVQTVITELGFIRNGSARQLRVGRTQSLGLIVLDVSNPFFTEVAHGAEAAASERGYMLVLCNTENKPEKEAHYFETLAEQRVAGILIVPTTAYKEGAMSHTAPIVLLDRLSRNDSLCSVSVDDVLGGELAAQHLLAAGHRRIAYVHGSLNHLQYVDRLNGLRRGVINAGLDPAQVIVSLLAPADNAQGGLACVADFCAMAERPTAIFCGNDYLAVGIMHGLLQRHVAVPEEVALIGYDDIDLASMFPVALTTIRQPKYQLGYAAAELLLEEVTHSPSHMHRHIVFQPELIVRASSQRAGEAARSHHEMTGTAKGV